MAKAHLKLNSAINNVAETKKYKIVINSLHHHSVHANELSSKTIDLSLNDYVKNIDGLIGQVKKKTIETIIVAWNDNTFERIQIVNLNNNYLQKVSNAEYVSTIENQISPLQGSSINTAAKDNTIKDNTIKDEDEDNFIKSDSIENDSIENDSIENDSIKSDFIKDSWTNIDIDIDNEKEKEKEKINGMDEIEEFAIEENLNIDKPENLKELQLQQKVTELEDKLHNKQVDQLKQSAAQKLVQLAIDKSIIDENDKEIEIIKVMAFDDEAFNKYKDLVLNTTVDNDEVSSIPEYEGLSPKEIEAHNMLNKIRQQQGTFSLPSSGSGYTSDTRSIADYKNTNQITFDSTNHGTKVAMKQATLDDGLMALLNSQSSSSLQSSQDINNYTNTNFDLDADGFSTDFNSDLDNNSSNSNYDLNTANDSYSDLSLEAIMDQVKQENDNSQTVHNAAMNNHNGFLKKPFSGLTKPLLMSNADNINPINTAFKELFSPDMWTSIGRR